MVWVLDGVEGTGRCGVSAVMAEGKKVGKYLL